MKLLMPGTPKAAPGVPAPPLSLVVSPGELEPGPSRTVGARSLESTPFPGNQWAAILVPSNEVIVTSLADAAGAHASIPAMTAATGTTPSTRLHMARDGTTANGPPRWS